MKLILCKKCHDVFKLDHQARRCKCGECGGGYLDDLNAEYWGESAVPLGFANSSLIEAVLNQPEEGWGENFEAFVIPKNCDTMKKIETPLIYLQPGRIRPEGGKQ